MKRPKTSTIFRYYNENWKVPLAFCWKNWDTILRFRILAFFVILFFDCGYFLPALYLFVSSFLFLLWIKFLGENSKRDLHLVEEGV